MFRNTKNPAQSKLDDKLYFVDGSALHLYINDVNCILVLEENILKCSDTSCASPNDVRFILHSECTH